MSGKRSTLVRAAAVFAAVVAMAAGAGPVLGAEQVRPGQRCALARGATNACGVAPEPETAPPGPAPPSAADGNAQLTARQVLDLVENAYAGCRTYRDTGRSQAEIVADDCSITFFREFSTAFVRPDRFRLEYSMGPQGEEWFRHVIWRQGSAVRVWWSVKPGLEQPESLGLALAGATGVSGGVAHTIPALLLPAEVGGRRLTEVEHPRRAPDESLGGVECYRVEGTWAGQPITLWVECGTFVVRQILRISQYDDFLCRDTTTYEPAFDEPVSEEMLRIGLPE